MKPSMKITSDKQMHMYLSLVGNACISEKSCSCIAVEKSSSMWVKLGHLLANSCSTVWVISSIGNSMYLRDAAKRTLQNKKPNKVQFFVFKFAGIFVFRSFVFCLGIRGLIGFLKCGNNYLISCSRLSREPTCNPLISGLRETCCQSLVS